MKRFVPTRVFCLAFLTATLTVACKQDKPPQPDSQSDVERPLQAGKAPSADIKAVAQGSNAFACELHRQLKRDGNLFFSPLSISTALSMTYAGARGDTAKEMATTLRYPFEGQRLHLGYAGLIGKLAGEDRPAGVQLSLANSLWGPYDYNQDFLAVNRDCYAAYLRKIQLVGAERIINQWVMERTAQRIKDLLPPGTLDANSVLVLVNAVYFKGQWQFLFKASATHDQEFRVKPGQKVKAKMMHQKARLRHTHVGGKDGVGVLELPYKGGDLSMGLILPDADNGLAEVEKTLTAEKLDGWLKQMRKTIVKVSLPRFKITSDTISLKKELDKLGMKGAFTPRADFSGMATTKPLYIDEVLHKSFVEVNEEGSEAAAASAVIMTEKGGADRKEEPVEFTADHPFLFLIRDNRTGCILFLGRLSNPTSPQ
jgi:serpin B